MAALPGPLEVCHKPIERIAGDGIGLEGQVGVYGGGSRGIVPQLLLDEAQVHSCFKQMGSITTWKVVAKNSRTDEDEEVRGKDGGKCPAWEPGLTPDSSAACGTRRDQHVQM
jgi:hypothetical protein